MEGKTNKLAAIPALIERLGEKSALKGAIVSIHPHPTYAAIARAVTNAGADCLLAVNANQPARKSSTSASMPLWLPFRAST